MQMEQAIRLSFFAAVLLLVALWEIIAPRRPLRDNKGRRWFTNLSLVVIDTVAVRLLFPILLGAPVEGILAFEVVLNACAMFSHGNIRFPASLDRTLRLFLVTPDMHRVHHSTVIRETNSNFGFNLPWWDLNTGDVTPMGCPL